MEDMLAGDADRERAVNVLREAFTEGRLTQDEYVDRVGLVYQARTYHDLDGLTADIPVPPALRPAPPAPPAVAPYRAHPPFRPPGPTNSNATASLVCGVVGFMTLGVTSPFAIVFGHVAKRQIRERGEQGDGMATGGLVLGYLAVVGWVLFVGVIVAVAAAVN